MTIRGGTGFFKKNSHPPTCCHITPAPPAPPWSMLLPNACRHPNRNGCFFEDLSQQSDVATLNWGKGGMQVSSQWVWQDGCFLKNPDSVRERFSWFMDVQTQAWTNSLLRLPKPQSKHTFIFKASTQQTKKHNIYLFGLMALQTQAWTNSRLHLPKPNANTLSSSQLLPTNKECSSTPPEAELHKLRVLHSARTVHVQCTHSARHSARRSARQQNAVNTMGLAFFDFFIKKKKILFFVFSSFFGKYVVFTAFCGRALWRAL